MKQKIIIICALLLAVINTQAQYKTDIPLDKVIRTGILDNGMHYYIRNNTEQKERASFYFVQNVGAILEEDHQNGLAHFLEHMAFNGSKHFKGKGIINFLEKKRCRIW